LLRWIGEEEILRQMRPGRRVVAQVEQDSPKPGMSLQGGGWCGHTLRQPYKLFPQLPRRLQSSLGLIKPR
jgi:hypothetical protein